jgi:hypothetical protein
MPSPESPENRITTSSFSTICELLLIIQILIFDFHYFKQAHWTIVYQCIVKSWNID